jgi:hypothetical protein
MSHALRPNQSIKPTTQDRVVALDIATARSRELSLCS